MWNFGCTGVKINYIFFALEYNITSFFTNSFNLHRPQRHTTCFMLQSVFRKSSSKNVLPGDKAVIPKTHHFHEGNIYLDVFAELLIPTKLD